MRFFLKPRIPVYMQPYLSKQVGADDTVVLDQIIDSLTSIANQSESDGFMKKEKNKISLKLGKVQETGVENQKDTDKKTAVLILGAGRVCRPAAELLSSIGSNSSHQLVKTFMATNCEEQYDVQVIVASLYLKDAEEVYLEMKVLWISNSSSDFTISILASAD